MGNMWYAYVSHPDTAPDLDSPPTFDPLLGFPEGRVERTIKATREDLERASVPLNRRDYCVDYYLEWMKCRYDHFPRIGKYCSGYQHTWEKCQREDTILRMKEYERERRLKERAKRIASRHGHEEEE